MHYAFFQIDRGGMMREIEGNSIVFVDKMLGRG